MSCYICCRHRLFLVRLEKPEARFWRDLGLFWKLRTVIFNCFLAPARSPCQTVLDALEPQLLLWFPLLSVNLLFLELGPTNEKRLLQEPVVELPTNTVNDTHALNFSCMVCEASNYFDYKRLPLFSTESWRGSSRRVAAQDQPRRGAGSRGLPEEVGAATKAVAPRDAGNRIQDFIVVFLHSVFFYFLLSF